MPRRDDGSRTSPLTGGNSVDFHSKEHIGASAQRSNASSSHADAAAQSPFLGLYHRDFPSFRLGSGRARDGSGRSRAARRRSGNTQPGRPG